MPFTCFLALRYLKPKRTFLSLITLISILGVVLGISVLIIVISVMTGFERELQRKIIGFDADVLISGNEVMNNWREILDRTKKTQGVAAAAPFAQGRVIVQFQNHRAVPWLRGIDPDLEQSVANLKQFLVAGEFDLGGDNGIIGSELASTLGVSIGDTIEIYSPHDMGELQKALDAAEGKPDNHQELKRVRELILPMEITVTGMFNSGRYAYDSDYIIVPLHIMQEAYSLGGEHDINTNAAEGFFSRMRRGEIGHHHHVAGPYLIRFAQEAAFREDHRRDPNGSQVDRVVTLAMRNKPSVDFCGYWQRSQTA